MAEGCKSRSDGKGGLRGVVVRSVFSRWCARSWAPWGDGQLSPEKWISAAQRLCEGRFTRLSGAHAPKKMRENALNDIFLLTFYCRFVIICIDNFGAQCRFPIHHRVEHDGDYVDASSRCDVGEGWCRGKGSKASGCRSSLAGLYSLFFLAVVLLRKEVSAGG